MPNVKFYYFDIKALGEGPRLLLSYGGQDFEDIRFDKEAWPKYKPLMPFGQAPLLEIDGKKYAQSAAISRYLGRKYNVAGKDLEEDFKIDEINDFVNDIRTKAALVHYEPDAALSDKKHAENWQNLYPVLLGKLDSIVADNKGYLALGRLTWADFVFAGIYDYLKMMLRTPDLESKYPNLQRVAQNVYKLPQLKSYLEKTPKTNA